MDSVLLFSMMRPLQIFNHRAREKQRMMLYSIRDQKIRGKHFINGQKRCCLAQHPKKLSNEKDTTKRKMISIRYKLQKQN